MVKWFSRFADIPKLAYQSPSHIRPKTLPGYNSKPRVERYNFASSTASTSLIWNYDSMQTSQSPSSAWASSSNSQDPLIILRKLYEALELPGELEDYHFIFLGGYEALWKIRREHPWVIPELERLCWLDLKLVETYPEIIKLENNISRHALHVPAYDRLIYLYEREGYLDVALDLAERAVKFDQQHDALKRIREKVERLQTENVS
jgi:hypothetical protein